MQASERKLRKYERLDNLIRLNDIWRIELKDGVNVLGDAAECTQCELCMSYCAYKHTGVAATSLSAIIVDPKFVEWETDLTRLHRFVITVCEQCPGIAPCMEACSVPNAMKRDRKTGAVLVNRKNCTLCRACEKACPNSAIRFSGSLSRMIKCDLCNGEPKCVEVCPVKVLSYRKAR